MSVQKAYDTAQKAFQSGITKPYAFRIEQLKNMRRFLVEQEPALAKALAADLHRSDFEAIALELATTVVEVELMIKELAEWMAPKDTAVPFLFLPAQSTIAYEPYGVALVIGAFNYPVVLTLSPMIGTFLSPPSCCPPSDHHPAGAMAAGNAVVVKPSEMSTATEALLLEQLPRYLSGAGGSYQVVTGDYTVSADLLKLRWDKIFFTGSTRVGKIVLRAAAEHLTPVSLELGGKSPTIIDKSVRSLELAVKRVVWGKCVNAGQTCIAPDYVFVHEDLEKDFVRLVKETLAAFYGSDAKASPDLSRIITPAHYQRLYSLLDQNRDFIVCGGEVDEKTRFIAPTLFKPSASSKLMDEELFGPLLPYFTYKNPAEVKKHILANEKPLTMYIFAADQALVQGFIADCSSGSVVVNDVLFQFANMFAPFGGVGGSGMGGYRGKFSFECFSHRRSILYRDDHALLDIPIRYPPYSPMALSIFQLGSKVPALPAMDLKNLIKKVLFFGVAVAVGWFACQYK